MKYAETELTPTILEVLKQMSADWAAENSCRGYRRNGPEDIRGNRVFAALEGEEIIREMQWS